MIEWLLSSLTEIVWRPMPSPVAMAKYDRKAMVDGLVRMVDNLSAEEKEALRTALASQGRSPGGCLRSL